MGTLRDVWCARMRLRWLDNLDVVIAWHVIEARRSFRRALS